MSMKSKYRSGYKRHTNRNFNHVMLLTFSTMLFLGMIGSCIFLFIKLKANGATESNENTALIYVAGEDITRGQKIDISMLKEISVTPEMPIDYYCSLDCIDQVAVIDIPQGTSLLRNMLCLPEITDDQREVESEIISLSDNLVDNDYVDVRIMMPNGEDYIVLAKKSVHDLVRSEDSKEEVCYLWMSESEILYYSAAIVDAYLYPGSSLYTTRYIAPTIQQASIITYVPSLGTITMMKENPNLVQEAIQYLKADHRKQLENRLTDYLNKDIREVLWNEESIPSTSSTKEDITVNPAEVALPTESINEKVEVQSEDSQNSEEVENVFVEDAKEKEAFVE